MCDEKGADRASIRVGSLVFEVKLNGETSMTLGPLRVP